MTHRIKWVLDRHKATNHYYDKYLPYEFHLRMVVKTFEDFKHLLDKNMFTLPPLPRTIGDTDITFQVIEDACWGHDLIEDTRTSYNDVKEVLGEDVAEIIYAVTNLRGKNRAERGGPIYYDGIRKTKGATFVKLCDRIANVQYSKMTGSHMYQMYVKENDKFLSHIGSAYPRMNNYLINLINDTD